MSKVADTFCQGTLFYWPSECLLKSPVDDSPDQGCIYNTDAVLFITALLSMWLRLTFTWHQSTLILKLGCFENAVKIGAFTNNTVNHWSRKQSKTAKPRRFENGNVYSGVKSAGLEGVNRS